MLCAVCENETFVEDEDGFFVCDACGTQSQDFRQEVSEVDVAELGTFRRSRKVVRNYASAPDPSTRSDNVEDNPTLLAGVEPRDALLAALQCVLQMQVRVMITKLHVAPELKNVAGKMWFSLLKAARVMGDDQDDASSAAVVVTAVEPPTMGASASAASNASAPAFSPVRGWAARFAPEPSASPLWASPATSPAPHAPSEYDMPPRFLDLSSVQAQQSRDSQRRRMQAQAASLLAKPKLQLCLAILFLSCNYLCVPVLLMDILRLVERGELPFVSAHAALPPCFRKPTVAFRSLKPQRIPSSEKMFQLVRKVARVIEIPSDLPSWSPLAFWTTTLQDLALPEIMQQQIAQLAMLAPVSLHVHASTKTIPEVACMAFVVLVLKLHFGLDDSEPRSRDTAAHWNEWVAHMRVKFSKLFSPGTSLLSAMSASEEAQLLHFADQHVFAAANPTPATINDILHVLKQAVPASAPAAMSDNGPTSDATAAAPILQLPPDNPDVSQTYIHYSAADDLGEFHDAYAFLLAICATKCRASPETLQVAVNALERTLIVSSGSMP